MSDSLSVVVIGGGVGGIAAGLCLRQAGIDVQIFEQAEELAEVGAGLQVAPNCSRILMRLGLGPTLERFGVRPRRLESVGWQDGKLIATHELNGEPPLYGTPHYLLYRPHLIDGLREQLPSELLQLGARCVSVQQDSRHAYAVFDDGSEVAADVVIGADGIRSLVREQLFGPDEPTFAGTVAYRALIDAKQVDHLNLPNASTKWWGPTPEHHLVHYYVAGGNLVNVIAVVPEDEWRAESWTARGESDGLREAFRGYHAPIPELLDCVGEVYKWALHDRPPLSAWSQGRISLLGDACHPMVPFMGQGAAMAIEDAAVLARALGVATGDDAATALLTYEATRRERSSRMQGQSRSDTTESWRRREWVYGYNADEEPLVTPASAGSLTQDTNQLGRRISC